MQLNYSNQALPAELVQIMDEVNLHGFYVVHLAEFLPEIKSREEQMYVISVIARRLGLKVNFNLDNNLCVLER